MKVIKVKNYEEMSEEALKVMLGVVSENPNAVLGLATGSTPLGLYAKMAQDHRENGTSYANCRAVNLDEYVGLDASSDQSYVYFMRENLFKNIDIKLENTHIENGTAADKEAECARYNALLNELRQDIQLLGIGSNGHIAFNDPHVADFNDTAWVKVVDLDNKCRMQQVNDGCFASLDKVPTHAMTLTIPALMAASRHFCIVPAATKAEAVKATVEGKVSEICPASVLRHKPGAILYLDNDSSKLLE